jgi:hypothetical protein
MNMKKTIYSIIVSFLFLVSSCTLEQEVYDKIRACFRKTLKM